MSHLSQRPDSAPDSYEVGKAIPHESAALHVTGLALYTDDLVARTKDHLDPITSNFSQHLTGILHDLVDDARRKPNEEGAT